MVLNIIYLRPEYWVIAWLAGFKCSHLSANTLVMTTLTSESLADMMATTGAILDQHVSLLTFAN